MVSQINPNTPTYVASTTNISKESLDCGLKALGWCKSEYCQKLAKLRYFLLVFLLIGLLQGASKTYFRISTKQTTAFNYDLELIDWLLVSNYVFQALLAFIAAYWSQYFHRMSWLGGLTIFQGIFFCLSVIPTLTHFDFDVTSPKYNNFTSTCKSSLERFDFIEKERSDYTTKLFMLFFIQFGIALGYVAFYTIGLPYIDDNVTNIEDTPAIIGATIAVHVWGSVIGSALTFAADVQYLSWWFGWIILGPIIFVCGVLITLFPRKLLRTVLKQAAQRIIDGSSLRGREQNEFLDNVNFFPSIKRLLTNKVLLLNLLGLTIIKIGIVNYGFQEQNYLQSRFYFPTDENNGIMDEWMSRFLSYLLKPPVVGTCALVTGLILSKIKINGRFLSIWNISAGILIVLIFISYIFIDCSDSTTFAGIRKGILTQSYCSRDCICSTPDLRFLPVCPEKTNKTYFSPCHAGCRTETQLNDLVFFENCTCGLNTEIPIITSQTVRATLGACNMKECQAKWIVFQVLTVIVSGLFATIIVCKIMITIRSVLEQDKSLALALELFLTGIIVYVPGKIIYDIVTKNTCALWSSNYEKCLLQDSPLHGNILNFITITMIVIGIIFDVFVFIYTVDLDLYSRNSYYADPFQFTPPNFTLTPPSERVIVRPNNNSTTNQFETENITETTPILQPVKIQVQQEIQTNQQHKESDQTDEQNDQQHKEPDQTNGQNGKQYATTSLPHQYRRFNYPRTISPTSTTSSSQISPDISRYRRQGAIPKAKLPLAPSMEKLRQTSETDF